MFAPKAVEHSQVTSQKTQHISKVTAQDSHITLEAISLPRVLPLY